MSRALDDLDPRFRWVAFEFLARLTEAGIAVMIVSTRRTPAEHAENLRRGVSWTPHSKHLDGLAMDVCPYSTWLLHGADKLEWNADDAVWETIADMAEHLGLRSGYRWTQKDCGHVEYVVLPEPREATHV